MVGRNLLAFALLACTGPAPRPSSAEPSARGEDAPKPSFALPQEAGVGRSEVEGCAAYPETADQPTVRTALRPAQLAVQPVAGGVLVTHDLPHACCLKAEIATRVEGNVATVHETLSGKPCRCMCDSTLRTGVALAPGKYRIVVELERGGRTETVRAETISVP